MTRQETLADIAALPVSDVVKAHDAGGKTRPAWPRDSVVEATFSPCGRYRYALSEIWDPAGPLVLWVMMNPSVACTDYSDPTLRKTGMFSRSWGYGGQLIGNVHAYRATDKNRLLDVDDPVGPDNDTHILGMANIADLVVLAYGLPPKKLRRRGLQVVEMLRRHRGLSCLEILKDGETPTHPLYVSGTQQPIRWNDASQGPIT